MSRAAPILCSVVFFICGLSAGAQEISAAPEHKADMSYLDAFALGLVEGVTEFLPVSSTGHLVLANYFLGLNSDLPLSGADGKIIYSSETDELGAPKPYTMKQAADAYAIIIQIGAILAVALIYWKSLLKMLMGVLGRDKNGLKLLLNLLCAFMPAALIGLLFHRTIERHLFGEYPVIFALAAGGLLMIFVQRRYDAQKRDRAEETEIYDITLKQSLIIGLLQCVAMWPGTSRSMMTILGGYLAGLKPSKAAEFSFLLGLMTLSAAAAYKFYKDGQSMMNALDLGPLALGLIVAFVSAALSVKWLVGFLNRRGLAPFAYYRFAVAAALLLLFSL